MSTKFRTVTCSDRLDQLKTRGYSGLLKLLRNLLVLRRLYLFCRALPATDASPPQFQGASSEWGKPRASLAAQRRQSIQVMIPVIPEGSAAQGDDESDAGANASAQGLASAVGSTSAVDAATAPATGGGDAPVSAVAPGSGSGLYVRRSSAGSTQSRDTDRGAAGQGPLSPLASPMSMVAQVASAALIRGVSWGAQSGSAAGAAASPPWPGPGGQAQGQGIAQQRPLHATGSQSSVHAAVDGACAG